MSSSFPTSLDSLTDPGATSKLNSPSHSQQHTNINDAVEKLEAKVGVNSSAVTTSHDYKLSGVTGTDKAVSKTGTETLTNKTFTSPVLTDPSTTGTDSGAEVLENKTIGSGTKIIIGSDASGDIYYQGDDNALTRLAKGTASQILRMNTGETAPEWATLTINRAFCWYMEGTSVDGVAGATYIAPQNMTVVKVQGKTTSGTCTVTLKKGATTIDAINCSSTLATETSITSAAITAGDIITLTISSASSPVGLAVTMECTQH